MPRRTKIRKTGKGKRSRLRKSRKNKSRRYKNHKIKGGCSSTSCANSGSVDHNPPQWNSMIKGGSHDMNDNLYNQYTDITPYSISR